MSDLFKCDRCGVVADSADHLCKPHELAGKQDYCGQPVEEPGPVCGLMSMAMEFECESCGRPAERPEMVCKPTRL